MLYNFRRNCVNTVFLFIFQCSVTELGVLCLRNLAFGLDYWTCHSHRFQLFNFILVKKAMGKSDGGGRGLSICLLFCTFCATINLSFIKFSFVCDLRLTSSGLQTELRNHCRTVIHKHCIALLHYEWRWCGTNHYLNTHLRFTLEIVRMTGAQFFYIHVQDVVTISATKPKLVKQHFHSEFLNSTQTDVVK